MPSWQLWVQIREKEEDTDVLMYMMYVNDSLSSVGRWRAYFLTVNCIVVGGHQIHDIRDNDTIRSFC